MHPLGAIDLIGAHRILQTGWHFIVGITHIFKVADQIAECAVTVCRDAVMFLQKLIDIQGTVQRQLHLAIGEFIQ